VSQEPAIVCAHFRVRGQVQGVFFRASTEALARRLDISGWVRNGENGEVELIACGTAAQLEALEQWLWQGPAAARVTDVQRAMAQYQRFEGFEVRR
jgi:acylphosphatase